MKTNIERAAELLQRNNFTIAFAESATAGRLTSEFAMPENAGKYLKGGLVCYDACLKEDMLGVPKKLIDKFTPESPEVTAAITEGLVQLIGANIHIGVTGLPSAGGSETPEKPVGTMFIHALKDGKNLFKDRHVFSGTAADIILQTVNRVAELLLKHLPK